MRNSGNDRRISRLAQLALWVCNFGLFLTVWLNYYNNITFFTHRTEGLVGVICMYAIIYGWFCHTYHAFRLASTTAFNAIFSQLVSFGVADTAVYLVSCFSQHRFTNMQPGLIAAAGQFVGTTVLVILFQHLLKKLVHPGRVLVLYGDRETDTSARAFASQLNRRFPHLFRVGDVVSQDITLDMLEKYIEKNDIVLLYEIRHGRRSRFMKLCTEKRKPFYYTPEIEDIFCQGSEEKTLADTPLMKYRYAYESTANRFAKRAFDLCFSALMLLVLSPLLLIVALLIKLEDGGPVFYRQKRCTRGGRVFEILKFRSMIVDAEKNGVQPSTGKRDPRITRIGRFIRATRVDELPQLVNILKNDMSFVGPRPERVEHVEQYTNEIPEFSYRLRVKGGLTGLAQIWGKYNTSAYDKLRWDLMYIENQSFYFDLKLLILTFRTVFQKESTEGFTEEKSNEIHNKSSENQ